MIFSGDVRPSRALRSSYGCFLPIERVSGNPTHRATSIWAGGAPPNHLFGRYRSLGAQSSLYFLRLIGIPLSYTRDAEITHGAFRQIRLSRPENNVNIPTENLVSKTVYKKTISLGQKYKNSPNLKSNLRKSTLIKSKGDLIWINPIFVYKRQYIWRGEI